MGLGYAFPMLYDPTLIVTLETRPLVIDAMRSRYNETWMHSLTNVQLANLYHEPPSQVHAATAKAVLDTMASMGHQAGGLTAAEVRALVREELEAQLPQRIEVVTPRAAVVLSGPLHYRTETVIRVCALAHPALLVGPAGCGKTTIGEHTAKALDLPFYITNTINDTHELMGFVDGYGNYHGTSFRQAFEHGGLWIADEIDAWDASALLAANSALANGFANFPDQPNPVLRNADFRMVATANTYGSGADRIYIGRNELDAASLDRFVTINVDYDLRLEQMFANNQEAWLEYVWKVRKIVNEKKIRHVVSSRAIAMGAAALNAGFEWDDVEDMYLLKGMSERDREKLRD